MKQLKTSSFLFRVLLCSWFLFSLLLASCSAEESEGPVREPAVAGAFYPRDPKELAGMVDALLADARPPAVEGRIRVLMVPHAGYIYSGSVAAAGFKALEGQKYRTVVVIGNSHREGYSGASVFAKGKFVTPLGEIEIDADLARKLMDANPAIMERDSAHREEHSLEVELPFLQKTIGSFKLVPILLGAGSPEVARILSDALAANVDDQTLVVISTDMSHYPRYDDANYADQTTVKAILSGDADNLDRTLRQLDRMGIPNAVTFLCGEGAVQSGVIFAKRIGAERIQLLKYANSGDSAGDKGRVVGYAAISFSSAEENAMPKKEDDSLTKEEQDELLKLARLTVETYVTTRQPPAWSNRFPALEQKMGAFVTLKKHGDLRGCIGRFEPDLPIYKVVMEMAIAASTEDHRFSPVSPKELRALEYEISALSPLRKVANWKEIEIGKHGVEVVRGMRRGVFLPQVATEQGWDLETFMNNLCAHKAGLPADAWKDPDTTIYVFTAQVFGEGEHK